MRVFIDRDVCIGAGCCVAEAPRVFLLDEERKAIVLNADAADGQTLRRAAASCPTGAVVLDSDPER